MEETLFAGGGKGPVPLVANRALRVVNTDDRNANRVATAALELNNLIAKIIDYPINLLDHRFRQDLHFESDFNSGNRTTGNQVAVIRDRRLARDQLTERPIAPPGSHAAPLVLDIQDSVLPDENGLDQLRGTLDADEVFVQVHRNEITLARIAMRVDFAFKQTPELRE